MEVREAGLEDIDQLISWGRLFHRASTWSHVEFSEDSIRQKLIDTIESDQAVVLMHDCGMIGGFLAPVWITEGYVVAHESFWWAEKGGGSLLRAFERWAKENGAQSAVMMHLEDGTDRVQRIYEHMGYKAIERSYEKRL